MILGRSKGAGGSVSRPEEMVVLGIFLLVLLEKCQRSDKDRYDLEVSIGDVDRKIISFLNHGIAFHECNFPDFISAKEASKANSQLLAVSFENIGRIGLP